MDIKKLMGVGGHNVKGVHSGRRQSEGGKLFGLTLSG